MKKLISAQNMSVHLAGKSLFRTQEILHDISFDLGQSGLDVVAVNLFHSGARFDQGYIAFKAGKPCVDAFAPFITCHHSSLSFLG